MWGLGFIIVATAAPITLVPSPGGGVTFRGESSAGVVTGRVDVFEATLDLAVGQGRFRADATSLVTGFGPRDQRMLVYALDVATFPEIVFSVERVVRRDGGPGLDGPLTLEGALTIHGVSRPVSVVGLLSTEGSHLRLTGDVPVVLADYAIPDPSVVIASFSPSIHVLFDLVGDVSP